MLAALIATQHNQPAPPPHPVDSKYGNQFVAATTTFVCISIVRRAALITTNGDTLRGLLLSLPGQESYLDQLSRTYYRMVNALSTNDPDYLSAQISATIATTANLTGVLAALSVAPQNIITLIELQRQLAAAIAVLFSLAISST